MSSRLQLDMCNLSLGRHHLVSAYEVKAGIGVIAGNTVWSMPERLECEVLQKVRYINTLTFTFTQKKVKERIVLREIHLRTTGRHLSIGSHSITCVCV